MYVPPQENRNKSLEEGLKEMNTWLLLLQSKEINRMYRDTPDKEFKILTYSDIT